MTYVEIAKFQLKKGVSVNDFLKVEDQIQTLIKSYKGFLCRELGQSGDGYWYMDLRFDTKQNMDQWMIQLKQEPLMKTYGAMLDFSSMRTEFYERLK